jgi:hypothetical protein
VRLLLGIAALAVTLAACGGSSDDAKRFDLATPKAKPTATPAGGGAASSGRPVSHAEAATIRGWADTLRAGHPKQAARYFAVPSEWSNGTPLSRFSTRKQVEAFNRGLPCGAKVVSLRRDPEGYAVAEFQLTERPGPGSCGTGTGGFAYTAFKIRHRHIVQWIRLPDPDMSPQQAS